MPSSTRFAKMSGAGNDFIVLDNRAGGWSGLEPDLIRRLCSRRLSVGADGLLLLEPGANGLDYSMRYFNADGSAAAMCGNGGRCLARFAVLVQACPEGRPLRFLAGNKTYQARVRGTSVRLSFPDPSAVTQDIRLNLNQGERTADFLDTGVPHAVVFTRRLEAEDVAGLGRDIRRHPRFQPAGTNVNFCRVETEHRVSVRTYERGVEAETLACGTGSAAAALAAARRGWVKSPVDVATAGGGILQMEFAEQNGLFTSVYQTGEARLIYWGEWSDEAVKF